MNLFRYIIPLTIAVSATSCGGDRHRAGSPANVHQAADTGRSDALKVIEVRGNNHAREDAILALRAKADAMHEHGYTAEAEAYLAAADSLLCDSLPGWNR